MNLLKLLRPKTTDDIIAPITRIVDRLDRHNGRQYDKSVRAHIEADNLRQKAQGFHDEADRAAAARRKIAGLLG